MITKYVAVCPLALGEYARIPFELEHKDAAHEDTPQQIAEHIARAIFPPDAAIHCWVERA